MIMKDASIICIVKKKPKARLRLICFPYAGGSSSTFVHWESLLGPAIELAVVQLPGRGVRLLEEPYQTMSEIVQALFKAHTEMEPKLSVFYGHSMGARVAYDLILKLSQNGNELPIHFIASGSIAPSIRKTNNSIYYLPDKLFINGLRALGGSPEEVLSSDEMMEMLLPALRADFKIIETYVNENTKKIPTKISVFSGELDECDPSDLELWFDLFKYNTGIHRIKGGHFFIDTHRDSVITELLHIINNYFDPSQEADMGGENSEQLSVQ